MFGTIPGSGYLISGQPYGILCWSSTLCKPSSVSTNRRAKDNTFILGTSCDGIRRPEFSILTRDSVYPVTDMVPARYEQRSIDVDELHVVDVHMERVLLRSFEVPLLDLVKGHVEQNVVGSFERLSSDSLTDLYSQSVHGVYGTSDRP